MEYEIILYYKYTPIADAKKLWQEQKEITKKLGLTGRLIIASEGINGTLEGTKENIDAYCKDLLCREGFEDIVIKRSVGDGKAFPKLKVKLRNEIVSSHLGEEDVKPYDLTGKYLSADELHSWYEKGEDFVVIDMRNTYEYKIGRFEGSLDAGLANFRDLKERVKDFEPLKKKKILTVCTGGVRCEKASGYLVSKGFEDVYQLQDGIVTYMAKYPNKAFKGKLYVFDNRIAMDFDDPSNHTVVGKCDLCDTPTEHYVNCKNVRCNKHFLACDTCFEEKDGFCSALCREVVMQKA